MAASGDKSASFTTASGDNSASVVLNSSPSFVISNISNLILMKLDCHNYLLWRSQFEPLLLSYDLMGYVDGSNLALSDIFVTRIRISQPPLTLHSKYGLGRTCFVGFVLHFLSTFYPKWLAFVPLVRFGQLLNIDVPRSLARSDY